MTIEDGVLDFMRRNQLRAGTLYSCKNTCFFKIFNM